MKAATLPVQRPRDARLLVVDEAGRLVEHVRTDLPNLLRPGDLVVANDAATLPASLVGTHLVSGASIEVRLAGRASLAPAATPRFSAVWGEEMAGEGVHFLSLDPGDMDTPLHALAVPDADPATLARPADAAREIVARIDRERGGGSAVADDIADKVTVVAGRVERSAA